MPPPNTRENVGCSQEQHVSEKIEGFSTFDPTIVVKITSNFIEFLPFANGGAGQQEIEAAGSGALNPLGSTSHHAQSTPR